MLKFIKQFGKLKKENYIFFIGRLVTAMGSFVFPMMTFFLTQRLGYSDSFATLLLGIASILYLPASILGGRLADKFDRKKIIVVFDFISVSVYIISAILPFTFFSAVLIMIASWCQYAESSAYEAIVADFSTTSEREKAGTLGYLGTNIGIIVGSTFSGILFETHTRLAFLLNGLSIMISTILIMLFVNMKNRIVESEKELKLNTEYEQPIDEKISVFKMLKDKKSVIIMILVACLIWLPATVYGIVLPLKLKTLHGDAGAKIYGFLNGFNGFVVICFTPLMSLWLNKITEIPKCFFGLLLYVVGLVIYMITGNTIFLFLGMFFSTIGEIIVVLGSNPYFSRRVPISHLGRVTAISNVLWSILSAGISFAISGILLLTDNNYFIVFAIFAGISFIISILCISIYKLDKKRFPILYDSMKVNKNMEELNYEEKNNELC